jgi:co-chaperonin GroES (HSP10)
MSELTIKPVGRRLLVEMRDVEETYGETGLILAKEFQDREQHGEYRGKVLAIGEVAWADIKVQTQDGEKPCKPWCKVGDEILFQAYAGAKVDRDDDRRVLINDLDVLAVVEGSDNE